MDTSSLEIILKIVQTLGGAGSIGALYILWQAGFFKKGTNGSGNTSNIEQKIDVLTDNHIEHVQAGINEILIGQNKIIQLLGEIKEYGIKIRKNGHK